MKFFSIILAVISFSCTALALEGHSSQKGFKKIEFNIPLNDSSQLRPQDYLSTLLFTLRGFTVDQSASIKNIYFFETEHKRLARKNIILRVRNKSKNPEKGELTIKIRSPHSHEVFDLNPLMFDKNKGEIDVRGNAQTYSKSYVLKFNKDLSFKRPFDFFNFLKKKSPYTLSFLSHIEDVSQLQTLGNVKAYRHEVTYQGKGFPELRGLELDLDIWFFNNNKSYASLSFKVPMKKRYRYEETYKKLMDKLSPKGDSFPSKTSLYWKWMRSK